DLDFVAAREFRLRDLPTDSSRRLLPPAVVRAVGAIDVVVAGRARLNTEVVMEVPAHPLREELLPAVAVFRKGRIRVLFAKSRHVRRLLQRDVVDARRR